MASQPQLPPGLQKVVRLGLAKIFLNGAQVSLDELKRDLLACPGWRVWITVKNPRPLHAQGSCNPGFLKQAVN